MKYEYAANASRLHKKVGEILSTEKPWTGLKGEQEVLVTELFPEFSGKERYDWVIRDLRVVIECHGVQHYKVQTFGQDVGEAMMNFQAQKARDANKKEVALLNSWVYIEIPYTDEKKVNGDYLWKVYSTESRRSKPPEASPREISKKRKGWATDEQKARAKEYRRQQYQRAKELKKRFKNESKDK